MKPLLKQDTGLGGDPENLMWLILSIAMVPFIIACIIFIVLGQIVNAFACLCGIGMGVGIACKVDRDFKKKATDEQKDQNG